jgi:dihydroxyacetone kinase-like protein
MFLNKESLSALFHSSASLWLDNTGFLSEIDSRSGDGDHGVTIGKMAALTLLKLDEWRDKSIKSFIEELGAGFLGISGGSAGSLYGTLIEGFASPLDDETEIDAQKLKAMLSGSQEAMGDITKAAVGDKTMMDALIPAVEAAQKAPDDIAAILIAAAAAAEKGAADTENMVSKFGRARSYGEKTIGVKDAGAVSTSLLFEGFANGIEEWIARQEEGRCK